MQYTYIYARKTSKTAKLGMVNASATKHSPIKWYFFTLAFSTTTTTKKKTWLRREWKHNENHLATNVELGTRNRTKKRK